MPEMVIYENGEFTEYIGDLPLTETQKGALETFTNGCQEHNEKNIHRIVVDMEY
ncbi:MAG: hypothetical protein SVW57_04800 [Thermodesulfobacteriota bacterium]|nr:hypothetical protein [Thermodesulfobacteriota bacterium]